MRKMIFSLRPTLLSFCLLALASVAPAQNSLDPGSIATVTPVITYEQKWPAADPSWYEISIDSSGNASYSSKALAKQGEEEGAPYVLKFIASAPTRTQVFQLARDLNQFNGNFETRAKIAQTGVKTLTYRDGEQKSHTSLNYSDNQQMNQLIGIFQRISTTLELAQKLDFDLRFDKLGLDRDLKSMERLEKDRQLGELQVIAPTLERIANDNGIMNIARQRARRLLEQSRPEAVGADK